MTAFFFFAQAMRFLNHVCILVNINITEEELQKLDPKAESAYRSISPDVLGDIMNRGALCNTAGLRMYYLSFPLIAWMGGGWYLIGATLILVIVLRMMDFNIKVEKRQLVESRRKKDDGDAPRTEIPMGSMNQQKDPSAIVLEVSD